MATLVAIGYPDQGTAEQDANETQRLPLGEIEQKVKLFLIHF